MQVAVVGEDSFYLLKYDADVVEATLAGVLAWAGLAQRMGLPDVCVY